MAYLGNGIIYNLWVSFWGARFNNLCSSGPSDRYRNPVRSGPVCGLGSVSQWSRSGSFRRKFFPAARNFQKKSLERCGRFRQKIVEIGAILAIFEPFKVWKFRMPFFGKFGRSSQDLGESDYNSIKSRDDRLNSPKSGMCIFGLVIWCYDETMIWW